MPVPSNDRLKEVAARVTPGLKTQLEARGLQLGGPVFVRIFKEEAEVELWLWQEEDKQYHLFKTWSIARYSGTLGPKLQQGDGQAPEGFYFVPPRMMNPGSSYHLSFNLGYPNEYDLFHGRTGSLLMMHGNQVSIGCYAMGDRNIEEIYLLCDAALRAGQLFFRVHSFPFRMNPDRLARESENPWFDFWRNLRAGYEWFEEKRVPPEVIVTEGKYGFL